MVPMRDGVRLATDIYSPAGAGPWPAILVRTSYDKTYAEWDDVPEWYARRGYVFLIQDLRSRYKSEGDGRYYHTCNPWEGDDGYDAIEWIAAQPWCNGKVGMMGSSHRAIVQTQAALYLTADGSLADRPGASTALSYQHDPENPVPTAGGSIAHLAEISAPEGGWDQVPAFGERAAVYGGQGNQIVPWGPIDQRQRDWFAGDHAAGRKLSERADVLVFQTAPLDADTEITGQVAVKLWVSSSALDTDFTAKLVDVYPPNEDYPDGFELNLTDTVLRMRYRDSWTEPRMMEPGVIYAITITLPTTSNLFKAGHRIRVDIASSNFPRLEVNPNTGEPVGRHTHSIVATNAVHVGGDTPSHIALPVIPLERAITPSPGEAA